MVNILLNKLKLIAKNIGIKEYENKSEDHLIKILSEPKIKIGISKKSQKEIRDKFNESSFLNQK